MDPTSNACRQAFNRRRLLQGSLAAAATLAVPDLARRARGGIPALLEDGESETPASGGKADSCIFIWLGGGACHLDTWDPKRKGDPSMRVAGSAYDSIPTTVPDVSVSEHLPQMARLLERCLLIRSLHHDVVDEHAAATNRLHTGRPPTGTTLYPSLGSIVAAQKPPEADGVPAYVVMGYPSASRGPGFLGARHNYIYLTDTEAGPAGLRRPDDVTPERQADRLRLLSGLRRDFLERHPRDRLIRDYAEASEAGFRLAGPEFMPVFDVHTESVALRQRFGSEFGQRCLLARRLVESGVRFVEVSYNLNFINGTGWDTHNDGQVNQHLLIRDLDQALSALLEDLEARDRFGRTLVVVATEFGRPPEFDAGGGRGHHSKAFSVLLAGGGLAAGRVVGATDELARTIVERPVSVPDLHATIHHALGIDPSEELYDGDRPVPITDRGEPVDEAFA